MGKECLYAYFAGAIDADGFISVQRSNRKIGVKYTHQPTYYLVKIGFVGTASPVVQNLLKENFGGSVYTYTPKDPAHKPVYNWQADGHKAEAALRAILPYLISKKRQAELCLELLKLRADHWIEIKATQKPPYRITPEMEAEHKAFWQAVTELNQPRNRRVHFAETP